MPIADARWLVSVDLPVCRGLARGRARRADDRRRDNAAGTADAGETWRSASDWPRRTPRMPRSKMT